MSKDDWSLIDELKKALQADANETESNDSKILDFFKPELDNIQNDQIISFVKAILMKLWVKTPIEYASAFWTAPSSNIDGQHPPDEYGPIGLITHTKRTARIAIDICYSYNFTIEERDEVIAACILHDISKAVYNDDAGNIYFDSLHTFTVDSLIESIIIKDIDEAASDKHHTLDIPTDSILTILRLIRCSHGVDSSIPEVFPVTDQEKVIAAADHLASNLHFILPELFLGSIYVNS